jgi:hypothetical protein
MMTRMDAIGIILVIVGVLIIVGTTVLGRSSEGGAGDLARLMRRIPGGWLTGLVVVVIGLVIIAVPWGRPPDAGPPGNGPPGQDSPGNGPPGQDSPGNGPPGNDPPGQDGSRT